MYIYIYISNKNDVRQSCLMMLIFMRMNMFMNNVDLFDQHVDLFAQHVDLNVIEHVHEHFDLTLLAVFG